VRKKKEKNDRRRQNKVLIGARVTYPWKRCRDEAEATLERLFWPLKLVARAIQRRWSA